MIKNTQETMSPESKIKKGDQSSGVELYPEVVNRMIETIIVPKGNFLKMSMVITIIIDSECSF